MMGFKPRLKQYRFWEYLTNHRFLSLWHPVFSRWLLRLSVLRTYIVIHVSSPTHATGMDRAACETRLLPYEDLATRTADDIPSKGRAKDAKLSSPTSLCSEAPVRTITN